MGTQDDVDRTEEEGNEGIAGSQAGVIVAVVDTGINPYHEAFRAHDEWSLPLIEESVPVNLSLGLEEWDASIEADWDVLDALESETLYRFPGTKVVGAISFANKSSDSWEQFYGDWPLIVDHPDRGAHGTTVASRAVGTGFSLAGEAPNVGVVMVQGGITGLEWASEQEFIDMIVLSQGWGFYPGLPLPQPLLYPASIEVTEKATHQKPLFLSSGNGFSHHGLLPVWLPDTVGFPNWLKGMSGAPDAISVGATDGDRMTAWHNQDPYLVAGGCQVPVASGGSTTEADSSTGTSFAAPYVAGAAAMMVVEARELLGQTSIGIVHDPSLELPEGGWDSLSPTDSGLVLASGPPVGNGILADGLFTVRDLKDVLYHTSSPEPMETDADGDPCDLGERGGVPGTQALSGGAAFPLVGYGQVNEESLDLALAVLRGEEGRLDRPLADVHYVRAHLTKQALVRGDVSSTPGPIEDTVKPSDSSELGATSDLIVGEA